MSDEFVETTSTSWFSRLGGSLKQCLFGVVLFIVAVPVLFWNEGRAVDRYKALQEGLSSHKSVPNENIDPENQDKLVHLTGLATTDQVLRDSDFNVEETAIRLLRKTEMYQWDEETKKETKKKIGGGTEEYTTYKYNKRWSSTLINSSRFEKSGYSNPKYMKHESKHWNASNVKLGAFLLSPNILALITHSESVAPKTTEGTSTLTSDGYLYIGKGSENSPEIGDIRIRFSAVKPQNVSIIAAQVGKTLAEYQTKTGSLLIVHEGIKTAEVMFAEEEDANKMMTWIIRAVGFLLMLFGLVTFLSPLATLADVLPFLGNIVSAGTFLIAFLVSLAAWCIVVAVAWLFYRPLLSICLIVVTLGAFAAIKFLPKKQTPKPEPKEEVATS